VCPVTIVIVVSDDVGYPLPSAEMLVSSMMCWNGHYVCDMRTKEDLMLPAVCTTVPWRWDVTLSLAANLGTINCVSNIIPKLHTQTFPVCPWGVMCLGFVVKLVKSTLPQLVQQTAKNKNGNGNGNGNDSGTSTLLTMGWLFHRGKQKKLNDCWVQIR
jgi:hypothetical protein